MANFYKWLKNGSSREAAVDGSSTAVEFEYDPQDLVNLERMMVYIQGSGTPASTRRRCRGWSPYNDDPMPVRTILW